MPVWVSGFDKSIQTEKLNQLKSERNALRFDVTVQNSEINKSFVFYGQVSELSKYISQYTGRFIISINDSYDISACSEGGIVSYNDGIEEFVYDGEFRIVSMYDYYILVDGTHKLFRKFGSGLAQIMKNPILANRGSYDLDVIHGDQIVAHFRISDGVIRF